ncbi:MULTISPECIES: M48 family metallopeptidase [Sphingobacterium]|jgi:predicted Zn-dependent protease|uniref:M48 family metallopeptidase n=1 Tax=Sphingobacterium litopenaei TaxID=2763500 RepID=A0ABR7YFB7_9SPHI|nr:MULTISPECIES: M48 family metallopeptidase [Sphingobacterium]MBD1429998.1 M48 family metallopeptidase [Sphingobacterium litopenaei]NGM72290.1 M48 family metallopeptidase [Sphingobacterium sp. SGL-16]
MKKIFTYASYVLLGATLMGCATSAVTGRKYLKLVDSETINQQASLAYKEFLSDKSTKVVTGTAQATAVKRVGNNIAAATQRYLQQKGIADQFNFNWEFNLIQNDDVNAWCMPGGKVAVFTGILPLSGTDGGLATIMGHEIAHALEEHSVAQVSNQMALQLGAQVLGAASQMSNNKGVAVLNQVYGIGAPIGMLKFSRNDELAADKAGLIIMAMAGYDPNEAVKFWERMAAAKSGANSVPEWLSTHPSDARRIAQIQSLVPEAMQYYKK